MGWLHMLCWLFKQRIAHIVDNRRF